MYRERYRKYLLAKPMPEGTPDHLIFSRNPILMATY
jgi:hypothetical protein